MLEPFYNGILFSIIALWLLGTLRVGKPRVMADWLRNHKALSLGLVWGVFITFAACYILFFNQLDGGHDIPGAVDGAVNGLTQGFNPYVDPVVPRFDGREGLLHSMGMGTYNYLPLDLLVYTGMHGMLGAAGMPAWFVISNLLFSVLAFMLFRELAPIKWIFYIPFAGTVILFYSFDNCSLTILLMVMSIYSLRILKTRYSEALSVVLMGLAVMTKVYAAIPFAVLVIWLVQEKVRAGQRVELGKVLLAVGTSLAIGIAIVLPFGLNNVLDSAVFFHLSATTRGDTSSGGTVLAEFAMGNAYYAYIAIGSVIAATVASLRLRDLNDRIVIVSAVFLLVVVKSSLSLVTIPGLFLAVRFCEWGRPLASAQVKPSTDREPSKLKMRAPDPEESG